MTDRLAYLAPRITLIVPALLLLACEQPSPPGTDEADTSDSVDTGTDTNTSDPTAESGTSMGETDDTTTAPGDDPLCPMVDGASWSYVITNSGGQVLGMDDTSFVATTVEGQAAFDQVDEPDAQGDASVSTLIQQGDEVFRVHRVESTNGATTGTFDYDPGFLRCSNAWTDVGPAQEYFYDRTASDANGQNPMTEPRGHTFEVVAVGEMVTVPAGTFETIKVERIRTVGTEAGALVWFWFAPGVGKVREERPIEMEIEELVSVSIPGGVNLP